MVVLYEIKNFLTPLFILQYKAEKYNTNTTYCM